MLDAVEQDTLGQEPPLAYELFARVDVGSVRVDEMKHGLKLAQTHRELSHLTGFLERVPLSNHEPVGHLLKQVPKALVVRTALLVVLSDQEEVIEARGFE